MPNLSLKRHPPIDVEYRWISVQEEDLNLGVKVMFMATICMIMGLAWVILMSYDRDNGSGKCAVIYYVTMCYTYLYTCIY
jgi:hypothetical protein